MTKIDNGSMVAIDPELESHTMDKLIEQYNFGLSYGLNDTGNAKRMVDKHGDIIRYHSSNHGKCWYVWNDTRWCLDTTDEMHQIAKSVVNEMYTELGNITDVADRGKFFNHIQKSGNHRNLSSMIESAQNEQGIFMKIDDFDSHDDLLNVQNGMINLEDGSLIPHDKSKFITKLCPINYNPNATCPIWDKFLETSIPNQDIRDYLQRFFGYCLTGHRREEKMLIMLGKGGNGKGVMIDTLALVFGDYTRPTESSTVMEHRNDRSSSNDLADLYGYRFVRASETKEDKKLDMERIKTMTGGNTLKVRPLYNQYFEYIPKFKLVLDTNYKPIINSQGIAIWRRIDRVDFLVDFNTKNETRDNHLREKLKDEFEGILCWLVKGAIEWYKTELNTPQVILDLNDEYKQESDSIGEFMKACIDKDLESRIALNDIYTVYKQWCLYSEDTAISKIKFGKRLDDEGTKQPSNGIVWRLGLKYKPDFLEKLDQIGYYNGTELTDQWQSGLFSTYLKVPHEGGIVDRDINTTGFATDSTVQSTPLPKPRKDSTTSTTQNNSTVEKPVLSQQEVADVLTVIRTEWEALDKPVHSSEYIPMFVTSLKVRCMDKGYKLSQKSAEEHVKRAYKAWGWATY